MRPSGTGPFPAVAELRADLPTHTLYRPVTLPKTPLPVYLWGNGACRDNGLQHGAYLRQVASHGYLVIAIGRPRAERPLEPVAGGRSAAARGPGGDATESAPHARRDAGVAAPSTRSRG